MPVRPCTTSAGNACNPTGLIVHVRLFIISEAAKKIPQQVRVRHPEVEWKAMAGLRGVLAHAHFALDDATLWDIIDNEVPELLRHVRIILQES